MKKLTVLTVVLTIALLLPFSISAQTTTTTTPEPIDQSALVVETETVMVPQVNITKVTGFEQESWKFIKALNGGGLGNIVSYLHPLGPLSRMIKGKKTGYLRDHWFKALSFNKFIKTEARSETYVATLFEGSYLPVSAMKNAELEAVLKESGKEEALKQMGALKPLSTTIALLWAKTKDKWSIVNIEFH